MRRARYTQSFKRSAVVHAHQMMHCKKLTILSLNVTALMFLVTGASNWLLAVNQNEFLAARLRVPKLVAYMFTLPPYAFQVVGSMALFHPLVRDSHRRRAFLLAMLAFTTTIDIVMSITLHEADGQTRAFFAALSCIQNAMISASSRQDALQAIQHTNNRPWQPICDKYAYHIRYCSTRYKLSSIATLVIGCLLVHILYIANVFFYSHNMMVCECAKTRAHRSLAMIAFVASVGSEDRGSGFDVNYVRRRLHQHMH